METFDYRPGDLNNESYIFEDLTPASIGLTTVSDKQQRRHGISYEHVDGPALYGKNNHSLIFVMANCCDTYRAMRSVVPLTVVYSISALIKNFVRSKGEQLFEIRGCLFRRASIVASR